MGRDLKVLTTRPEAAEAGLTDRQYVFVEALRKTGSIGQAAVEAGMVSGEAHAALKRPNVQRALFKSAEASLLVLWLKVLLRLEQEVDDVVDPRMLVALFKTLTDVQVGKVAPRANVLDDDPEVLRRQFMDKLLKLSKAGVIETVANPVKALTRD